MTTKQKKSIKKSKGTTPLSAAPTRKVRGGLNPRERVYTAISGPSMTVQEYKDECDINNIVNQFVKTGTVTHVNRRQGYYGHVTGEDFSDAMRVVTEAQIMFDDLPSEVRKNFGNDPAALLDFVENASPDELTAAGLTVLEPIDSNPGETPKMPPAPSEGASGDPAPKDGS